MLVRKALAWLFTTILCIIVYSLTIPTLGFFTFLSVLPFATAIGALLSIVIELVTNNLNRRKLISFLLHLIVAYLVYKVMVVPMWSIFVYVFALPISIIYWFTDETIRVKNKPKKIVSN
ncbi:MULTISPECIES: hypothetical protein [Bacillaceae]|uniref:hypothetical protein n=1 Tax=Bacillaceae TaxID=186817 RepID=UPI0003681498|nr:MULTISPECIES: hypothetical protein [Bacillaceae]